MKNIPPAPGRDARSQPFVRSPPPISQNSVVNSRTGEDPLSAGIPHGKNSPDAPASHFALANAASSTRGPKRTEGLHEHLLHLRQTCGGPLRQMEPQRGFVPRPQRFVVPQSLRHLELTE